MLDFFGVGGIARILSLNTSQKILSHHYPDHIKSDAGARILQNYNIILPDERLRVGNDDR